MKKSIKELGEADNLKKQKIIMQSKLKQKEDKITDLTKRIREMSISAKSSSTSTGLDNKVKELEAELARSRKVNKDLRAENSKLTQKVEEINRELKSMPKVSEGTKLEKVTLPGSSKKGEASATASGDSEEIEYLQSQVAKKDALISRLSDQLNMFSPEQISQIGSSYMKTRQMNAKVRELKSQLEMAKKNETAMRQRMDDMQRKMAMRDDNLKW